MRNSIKPLAVLALPVVLVAAIGVAGLLTDLPAVAGIAVILLLALIAAYVAGAFVQQRNYQRALMRELKAIRRAQTKHRSDMSKSAASMRRITRRYDRLSNQFERTRAAIDAQEFRTRLYLDQHLSALRSPGENGG